MMRVLVTSLILKREIGICLFKKLLCLEMDLLWIYNTIRGPTFAVCSQIAGGAVTSSLKMLTWKTACI